MGQEDKARATLLWPFFLDYGRVDMVDKTQARNQIIKYILTFFGVDAMQSPRNLLVIFLCICCLTGCGNAKGTLNEQGTTKYLDLTELLNLQINDISCISVSRNGWDGEEIQPGDGTSVISYVYEMIRGCKIIQVLETDELSKFSSDDGSVSMGTINSVRIHLTSNEIVEFNIYYAHGILEIADNQDNKTWYMVESDWLEAIVEQTTNLLIAAAVADNNSESSAAIDSIVETPPYEGTDIEDLPNEQNRQLPNRELIVKLVDVNDTPIVNATISVNDTSSFARAFTDANGENTLSTETLQYSDVYIFHVQMMRINGAIVNEDMPIQADLLAVECPMIIQLNNFKVEKEYPESLNVFELVFVDKDHTPIPNVWCSVGRTDAPPQPNTSSNEEFFLKYGYSNSDGKRYILDLKPGEHIVNAEKDGALYQACFLIDEHQTKGFVTCIIDGNNMIIRLS